VGAARPARPRPIRYAVALALVAKALLVGVFSQLAGASAPELVVAGQVGGAASAVAVAGSRAYVGTGAWLTVWDVADPSRPRALGRLSFADHIQDLAVQGSFVYAAVGPSGHPAPPSGALHVVDVSDPAAPRARGVFSTSELTYGLAVTGDHVFLANSLAGLRVLRVSDPDHPVEVARLTFPSPGYTPAFEELFAVAVDGRHAYVTTYASSGGSLRVVDVADPTGPVVLGRAPANGLDSSVAVAGGVAYVAAGALQVFDVSDPRAPMLLRRWEEPSRALSVAANGNRVYYGTSSWTSPPMEVVALDTSDPSRPVEVARHSLPGMVSDLAIVDGRAYVAEGWSWRILDVSAGGLTELYAQAMTFRPNLLRRADDTAFLSDGRLLDVSDPGDPRWLGYFVPERLRAEAQPNSAQPRVHALVDRHAYVRDGLGILIADVSDPLAPVELGHFPACSHLRALAVGDGYAYLACAWEGLWVADVRDPASARLVARMERMHDDVYVSIVDVAVAGRFAYLADENLAGSGYQGGLRIVDVADPANPVSLSLHGAPGPSTAFGVAVDGDFAYLGAGRAGVRVVDVADPTRPRGAGAWLPPEGGWATGVSVDAGHLWVGAIVRGVYALDLSTPTTPREAAAHDTPGRAYGARHAGGLVFVNDDEQGLLLLRSGLASPVQTSTPTATARDVPAATASPTPTPTATATETPSPTPTPDGAHPSATVAADPGETATPPDAATAVPAGPAGGASPPVAPGAGFQPAPPPPATRSPTLTAVAATPSATSSPTATPQPVADPAGVAPAPIEAFPPGIPAPDGARGGTAWLVPAAVPGTAGEVRLAVGPTAPFTAEVVVPVGEAALGVVLQPRTAEEVTVALPEGAAVAKSLEITVFDPTAGSVRHVHPEPLTVTLGLSPAEQELCHRSPSRLAVFHTDGAARLTRLVAAADCDRGLVTARVRETSGIGLALLERWDALPFRLRLAALDS
jgi:hypothetical protein